MTIGTALFLALATLIVCTFIFLTMVYLKEYRREDKAINELLKQQKDSYSSLGGLPVMYLDIPVQTAPKTTKKAVSSDVALPTTDSKAKKDVN